MDSNTQKQMDVNKIITMLKKIMTKAIDSEKYEVALSAIACGCNILYEYNQKYYDNDFEDGVVSIARTNRFVDTDTLNKYIGKSDTVLFYDGFGLDSRGVSRIYLNALIKNKYHVIYVSPIKTASSMTKTKALFEGANVEWKKYDSKASYVKHAKKLLSIVLETHPKAMYFYTTPHDSAGAVAFAVMEGKVDRFLLDLTDHAFWLGVKCNDYFTGSRDISASNLLYERHVKKDQIIKLGGSILPDETCKDHSGLPFDVEKERYIFSGGSLYKTLGDPNNTYYRIVNHILETHPDIFFLYAGSGNTNQIDSIIEKYHDRAYRIDERPDYYYLIQNCLLYLNTYPVFGGMMMKYAAYAGKIPITLIHQEDSEGLLIDQKRRRIEYLSYEELITDVDKLLTDSIYLRNREILLKGSVVSEEDFIEDVRSTIEERKTRNIHSLAKIDTSKFREEYLTRFEMDAVFDKVSRIKNKALFPYFPIMVVNILKRKAKEIIRRGHSYD